MCGRVTDADGCFSALGVVTVAIGGCHTLVSDAKLPATPHLVECSTGTTPTAGDWISGCISNLYCVKYYSPKDQTHPTLSSV